MLLAQEVERSVRGIASTDFLLLSAIRRGAPTRPATMALRESNGSRREG